MTPNVLISVVMPAYKFEYFEQALDSALAQTYPAIELIICDDCPDERIARLVEQKRVDARVTIRYYRNEQRLGELASTARGIRLAKGRYIKFLHDDDVLEPDCVAALAAVIERERDVALVSSRRQRINEAGEPLPDILHTCFPFAGDVIINGKELVSFLGEYTFNFIGEPSCILARREHLLEIADELMSLNGKVIHWVGDLALYAKLLQRGNFAFLANALTNFRVSSLQFSQAGRDQIGIGDQGHADFRQAIRDLGWRRSEGNNRLVQVAPISNLKARVFKPVDLMAAIERATGLGSVPLFSWLGARWPSEIQQKLIDKRLATVSGGLRIAIAVLDTQGDKKAVEQTLISLQGLHAYENVDLKVFSTAPTLSDVDYTPVPLVIGEEARALNVMASASDAEWLLAVAAGVEFRAGALTQVALELLGAPESCVAVYADEVMRLQDGERGLALRPDLNLDLLLSFPRSLSAHWLFRRATLLELGGFAADCDNAFELEYQLRLIERLGLGCIGHINEPLLNSDAFTLQDSPFERQIIERHLHARGYNKARLDSTLPGRYEVDYGHEHTASVSILILVGQRLAQIQRCLDTILEKTDKVAYEVLLLDQGSGSVELRDWLAGVTALGSDQLRVLAFPDDLTLAALYNRAAQQARGDFLLWLGDGAGVLSEDWLAQLLNHGQRPEVGAVGAKLLSADGKVHHAGMLLGLNGTVGRAFEGAAIDDAGYMQRLQVDQNYSALSGECLMVRRDLFIEAGGFDETPVLAAWIETDLCLRLREAGYLNVWTPRVQLLLDAAPALRPSVVEQDALYERWLPALIADPAYNPGFSLQQEGGFKLADPQLSWQPLKSWRPLPVILAHPADQYGCGHYRMIQPFHALRDNGLVDGCLNYANLSLLDTMRYQPDVVVLQRQVGEERLEAMRRLRAFSSVFKIYELDDYLPNVPLKSVHRQHMPKDILKTLRRGTALVDRFVVSTAALAEAFSGLHERIRVVENRLPVSWWKGLKSERRVGSKPRVGWAGGASHTGDLELLLDVVKDLADEVDWVFFGMCPEKLRPYVQEFHSGVSIHQYPAALAGLDLDLALAPLEQNLFNECKSNLRLLEYGACGYPVVCSDIRCYQDGLPVTRVKNRYRDWVDAIRMHLADLDATARLGDELRQRVLADWMLEGEALRRWQDAWLPD